VAREGPVVAGHTVRKRFGQHFLTDPNTIRRIVDAIDPKPDERIVEIGPGLGAITEPLLARVPHLDVLEIDRDIIAALRQRHDASRLTIHEGDALAFPLDTLGSGLRVVGNLPYNISTPLLFHLGAFAAHLRDGHFMLQKEVVERMVAHAGTAEYGRLSVMLQYRFRMAKLFNVPPGCFRPPPKVDSAIVRMAPRPPAELQALDEKAFSTLVTQAFTRRRKTLRNALQGLLDETGIREAGLDAEARPETVDVDGFVRAANVMVRRQRAAG